MSAHVHRWKLPPPTPGEPTLEGRCACGEARRFLAHAIEGDAGDWTATVGAASRHKPTVREPKACPRCAALFVPKAPNQRYCDRACAKRAERERGRARARVSRQRAAAS